jgi:hypothetical protein
MTTMTSNRPAASSKNGEPPVDGKEDEPEVAVAVATVTTLPLINGVMVATGTGVEVGPVPTKFAVTLLFVLIVTVVGFELPLASPLQLLKL